MPYPEMFVAPMRQELTRFGVKELRTADDVDTAVTATAGTLMIVVNSVCGCAAGKARPGVAMALSHANRRISSRPSSRAPTSKPPIGPAATSPATRLRRHRSGLLRDGKLLYMLERSQIENRNAEEIAAALTSAFDKFCGRPVPA